MVVVIFDYKGTLTLLQEQTIIYKMKVPLYCWRNIHVKTFMSLLWSSLLFEYHTLDQDNKLIWNLRDMGHIIRSLSEGKGSQSRILIIMSEVQTMTQRELTERLGIQPGSASEVIGKLESAGLLKRTPSEEDRRTSDIRLTDAGRLKAMEAIEQRKVCHAEMFSCLSEEDKADFLILLEKVNNDWRYRYGEKASVQKYSNDGERCTHHSEKE